MGLIKFLLLRFRELEQTFLPAENPIWHRDKAMAMAKRVPVTRDGEFAKVYCPSCLSLLSSPVASDIRMVLALHLSLRHPSDVNLLWEIMQKKNKSILDVPSFVFGVGIAAGFGVLLVITYMWKNHSQSFWYQYILLHLKSRIKD